MNQGNKKVMVAGHLCLDIAPKIPHTLVGSFYDVFVPGKLVHVEDPVLCTGGAVSNVGLAMAGLGLDVLLNGKVGSDGFGTIIKQLIGRQHASAVKTVTDQCSSYTIILALPGVDRIFLHSPGTNDTFGSDDVDYESAKDCVLFHLGYPPLMKRFFEDDGEQLLLIYKKIKQLGVTTCMDMALPDPASPAGRANWQRIIKRVLPYVDLFMPSIEEIAYMLDRDLFEKRKAEAAGRDAVLFYQPQDYTKISEQLLQMGSAVVALKSGIRGYYLRTGSQAKLASIGRAVPAEPDKWADREIWAASFKTEQFGSATGSGDATIAGFLTAFIRGYCPEESLRIANAVGWQNVQALDALSGIRDWQTTVDFVRDMSRPRNEFTLDSRAWRYCPASQVYYGPGDKC
ncbi:MAG: carbohydrate kinase family protein [Planctomycetota bacterium]